MVEVNRRTVISRSTATDMLLDLRNTLAGISCIENLESEMAALERRYRSLRRGHRLRRGALTRR